MSFEQGFRKNETKELSPVLHIEQKDRAALSGAIGEVTALEKTLEQLPVGFLAPERQKGLLEKIRGQHILLAKSEINLSEIFNALSLPPLPPLAPSREEKPTPLGEAIRRLDARIAQIGSMSEQDFLNTASTPEDEIGSFMNVKNQQFKDRTAILNALRSERDSLEVSRTGLQDMLTEISELLQTRH